MNNRILKEIDSVLHELNEMATASMQTPSAGLTGELSIRWTAERDRRLAHLVNLYSAHKVARSVENLDSTLTDIERAVSSLEPV